MSAVLVESRRVAGRPRQRFVAHLATIRVWDAATGKGDVPIAGGGHACRVDARGFWEGVSLKLDVIGWAFDRDIVEARIAARVPRPARTWQVAAYAKRARQDSNLRPPV